MATVAHKVVKLEIDRSELDAVTADIEALAEKLDDIRAKLATLTLGVHLDMTGSED